MVGSSGCNPTSAPGIPTFVSPVRIGDCPVMNAARPAVQLCCAIPGGEQRAFRGDPVDVGSPESHHSAVVATRVEPADVVAHDDEDVRLLAFLLLVLRRRPAGFRIGQTNQLHFAHVTRAALRLGRRCGAGSGLLPTGLNIRRRGDA